jgi:hypothetical protein
VRHHTALLHRGRPPGLDSANALAQHSKLRTAEALDDLAKADVRPGKVPELASFLRSVAAIVREVPNWAWRAAVADAAVEDLDV